MNFRQAAMLLLGLLGSAASCAADEPITITLDASQVLNERSDQVGIWIDSRQDALSSDLITALDRLRIKSVRYGWGFALFDEQDLRTQAHSPLDPKTDGYFTDGNGRMGEKIGPGDIGRLLLKRKTPGFAVVGTDGINYAGTIDSALAAMTKEERIDLYAERAAQWARWGRDHNFTHFEIGNENDISGAGPKQGIIEPWDGAGYAEVASRYTTVIKDENPAAKCGINGGLVDDEKSRAWFRDIAESQPDLKDQIDFVVAHKYEMWLDEKTWRAHADWTFGRVQDVVRESRSKYFPDAVINVTELGSWKTGEIDHHYRAVLATEMLGNVYADSEVDHVHFWPTRWATEGGVFKPNGYELSSMGMGLALYSRFANPIMFANNSTGGVRYFASHDSDRKLSVWFINHVDVERTFLCRVQNQNPVADGQAWHLVSPTGQTQATATTIRRGEPVRLQRQEDAAQFTVTLPPLSATVVAFQ